MADLITSEERNELFATFERSAFHLELKDYYSAALDDDPFARWQRGEPDDHGWLEPWLAWVRPAACAGKTIRRVRVVTEPISEYIRWEHGMTFLNEEAGEDIRWLPRHKLPDEITFPVDGNDWWLFDDRLLAVGHVDDEGRVKGSHLVTDPDVVSACIRIRDHLWALATPHREYKPT